MGAFTNLIGDTISHYRSEFRSAVRALGIVVYSSKCLYSLHGFRSQQRRYSDEGHRRGRFGGRVIFQGGWSVFTQIKVGTLLKVNGLTVEKVLQLSRCGGSEPRIPLGD